MSSKQREKFRKKLFIIEILLVIVIIIICIYIVCWIVSCLKNNKIKDKISNNVEVNYVETDVGKQEAEYNIDFESLKKVNEDVVAWIKVNGTEIEYPIVQAKDNDYYLKRNLEKEYNTNGWIFADYRNKLDGTDKNIIIYGNNVKDNSMFGSLKNILNEEGYNDRKNYIIDFITEKENQRYQVFSVYQIKTEDYYINTEFEEGKFQDFTEILKRRSKKNFGIGIYEYESILTLSTCANNYRDRIVLHAKKINY